MDCSPPDSSLCPWNSPGKNTGVDSHSLLQGNFPIQDRTCISYIAGGFFFFFFFFLPLSHQGSLLHKFSSVQLLNHVQLFVIPWIAACQAFISYHSFNSHKVPEKILLVTPFFRWRARSLEKLTHMPKVSDWDATSSFPNIIDYVLSHQLIQPAQFPAPQS